MNYERDVEFWKSIEGKTPFEQMSAWAQREAKLVFSPMTLEQIVKDDEGEYGQAFMYYRAREPEWAIKLSSEMFDAAVRTVKALIVVKKNGQELPSCTQPDAEPKENE